MSNQEAFDNLDRMVPVTHDWINDLDRALRWNDRARSFRLLLAVLHTLRDTLDVREVADLAAHMPSLLRGIYYERWNPAQQPAKDLSIEGMLECVQPSFGKDLLDDPARATMTVLRLLAQKFAEGENVRDYLPANVRVFWPPSSGDSGSRPH